MLKRKTLLSFSALTLALASSGYAAVVTPVALTQPASLPITNLIHIPDVPGSIDINAAALWLQPGASNLNYITSITTMANGYPAFDNEVVKPSYQGAFEVGVKWNLPDLEAKSLALNWTHMRSSDSDTSGANGSSAILAPSYAIGYAGTTSTPTFLNTYYTYAKGKADFDYDVVNLSAIQRIDVGSRLSVHLFAGLSNADLGEKTSSYATGTSSALSQSGVVTDVPAAFTQKVDAEFEGIGPRVGIAGDYDLYEGLNIDGMAAISALIGSQSTKTSINSTGGFITNGNEAHDSDDATFGGTLQDNLTYQTIKTDSSIQVIPAIDAKLGLNYQYYFDPCTMVVLSAGYEAAVYVNAIEQYLPTELDRTVATSLDAQIFGLSQTLSNYSVQGPYIKLDVQFA